MNLISFSDLNVLIRTSNIMFNRISKASILALSLISGSIQSFIIKYHVNYKLFTVYPLPIVESFYPNGTEFSKLTFLYIIR